MVSLELEARLDNLLFTGQEETADIDLFAPITEKEECPICLIPLPLHENELTNFECCGKRICNGCVYKSILTEGRNGERKCAFCRQAPPEDTIKALKNLVKKNNPGAMLKMAARYEEGKGVFQSDTAIQTRWNTCV